ncbi:MAG: amidophosphoribosyltransferase [Porphyromonas sp.]|uniref:amidophosphoribosyltransferase n=1 Tax=Porphyromonas sp. TaxID=1924944 RepID=UPI002A90D531|nr:amidophosphoribosyltransferase [Porphyromonas sp.]MDD7468264.1 amidophosphoribosyltransferase [Bacteroidales bacterium]MDY6102816.1 amidophosphoribosyltransferase [Porphyromonas sp.]
MEQLKHECGVVLIRLRKPLEYYWEKYGTRRYGLNKLYLMMEKQHNRGQDGAGVACVKLQAPVGTEYLYRERALGSGAISEIFNTIHHSIDEAIADEEADDRFYVESAPYIGECYMGHLRYSTTGKSGMQYLQPALRRNNWRAKTLAMCGNFNLTTVKDIFKYITARGQHPRDTSDTRVLMELLGHRLDREVERRYADSVAKGFQGMDITEDIEDHIDALQPLRECGPMFDGGYVLCGMTGSGEMYAVRDPWGIRPAYYYYDDEIFVVASERPVIQTTLNLTFDKVHQLERGQAIAIDRSGENVHLEQVIEPQENRACSFERIYFSRGSDIDIYHERKALGSNVVPEILEKVDYDLDNTVFSFIPNTAEVAYQGMLQGLEDYLDRRKQELLEMPENRNSERIRDILRKRIRSEKVAIKDIKMRTFITEGASRNELAAHVYDVTYGSIRRGEDNLVVIDDSIVRGTTLRESVIRILNRLGPRKMVIVSSAPQIRYPDWYGIAMSRMEEFVAFRAAIALHQERGMEDRIGELYERIKSLIGSEEVRRTNFVKEIYEPFTVEELNQQMIKLMRPAEVTCPIDIVFQSIEGLHKAIPNNPGDWYFTGDYPTPGGMRLVNQAFIDYYEEDYRR